MPAATQGTIGIQNRIGDKAVRALIDPLMDRDAVLRTRAERAVATALQGSCQVPLAVFAELDSNKLRLRGMVGMPDGSTVIRTEQKGALADLDALAEAASGELLEQGGSMHLCHMVAFAVVIFILLYGLFMRK